MIVGIYFSGLISQVVSLLSLSYKAGTIVYDCRTYKYNCIKQGLLYMIVEGISISV